MFAPRSAPAQQILDITWLVIGIVGALGVVVMTMIIFSIIRYSHKQGDEKEQEDEPSADLRKQSDRTGMDSTPDTHRLRPFHGLSPWNIRNREGNATGGFAGSHRGGTSLVVEFEYPEYGFVTANELHIPIGDDGTEIPTFLSLQSADVIHSFWVRSWRARPTSSPTGTRTICGCSPTWRASTSAKRRVLRRRLANMLITVIVEPESEFKKWVAEQQKPAVVDESVAKGRHIFERTACINCHTIRGTVANGTFAPDLTHFMSRTVIEQGAAPNEPKYLRQWIRIHRPSSPAATCRP